jgi:hypothetical protein
VAFAERITKIANPASRRAGKKKRKNMAARKRHLSAKQIRAGFGGKRRQSALKSTRRHSARTRPVKRRNAAPKRHSHRASTRRKPARRRNPLEIVSILPALGNPAKKRGRKTMAAKKRHTKRRATAQRNAGSRRRTRKNMVVRHHRRRNPGMGRAGEFVKLGASVVGGAVGSKYATQLVLGAKNTSWLGYIGNLVATGLLGWGAHMAFKDKIISQGVIGGGIAQVIVRVIGDQTPYGSYLQGAGVGDYQASAFLTPQRMVNARQNATLEKPSWALSPPAAVVVTHPATGAAGMGWAADWN